MKTHLLPFPLLAFALCTLACGFGLAAARAQSPAAAPSPDNKKVLVHKIAPTDKLSISVVGEGELNVGGKRVDANGNLNLTYVGDVHVAGLTPTQAQAAIETAYRDGRYLRNPQVTINIEEYAQQTVSISGMVKGAGTFAIPPETTMTLKDLIQKAGGLSDTAAASKVRISRTMPDGSTKIFIKNVDGLLRARESATSGDGNFALEADDIIYVPEKII